MRKFLSIITVALLLSGRSATASIPATKAQETIAGITAREPVRSSAFGILAVKVNGDTVACFNQRQKLVPASNMKLLSTGLALRIFGPDYRFETSLGYTGEIVDSTLVGDLYIIGGGDPTTGSTADCALPYEKMFDEWVRIVRNAGISRIRGRIIGDPRFFGNADPVSLGWTYEDLGTYYGAGPKGLNFFENKKNFYITPGSTVGAAPNVAPRFPDTPWMKVGISATTGKAKTGNDLYFVNSELSPNGEIRGHFPVDRRGYTLECSNSFGAYTCAYYFYRHLNDSGIKSDGFGDISTLGKVRTDLSAYAEGEEAAAGCDLNVIGGTRSATLAEIVRETNKESDNFYAETLFKLIGKHIMRSAVADSCQKAAENALASMGLKVKGNCQVFDGSGLSRKNYVNAAFFVAFLKTMTRSTAFGPYLESLPVAGQKGTLEHRFDKVDDGLKERIHAKTGSMNGVRCLSGYIEASDGSPENMIVFSVLVNNSIAGSLTVNKMIDDILTALLEEN